MSRRQSILAAHIRYALRRTWAVPARSIFALIACALAWAAIFHADLEINNLEWATAHAGWLGGAQGYQVSIKKVYKEEAMRRATALPRVFVERAQQTAQASVIQLTRSISALSPDRLSATPAKLLFYDAALGAQTTPHSSFPPCSISQSSPQWQQQNGLMPLANGWRCYLSPLPAPLRILRGNYDMDSIAFPLAAAKEIAGRDALDEVEIMWLAIDNRQKFDSLLRWATGTLKLELDVAPLGTTLGAQTAKLSGITQIWLGAAGVLLLIGIGLYVHGLYAAMRREAGLRIALGTPFLHMARWLTTDVLTQALTLTLFAAVLGSIIYHAINVQPDPATVLRLTLLVAMFMVFFFTLISVVLTWHVMRQNRITAMIRD